MDTSTIFTRDIFVLLGLDQVVHTITILDLWNAVEEYGYTTRKTRMDGLSNWRLVKSSFEALKFDSMDKVTMTNQFIKFASAQVFQVDDLIDYTDLKMTINDTMLDNTIETHHFLIQHFRIPMIEKYNLNLVKILQLAYNIGQLRSVFENEAVYSDVIKNFYDDANLRHIITYLPSEIHNMVPHHR